MKEIREAKNMSENRLHLYTGDGKGKTTASFGLALRALGHGKRVMIAQFLKSGTSGELDGAKTFENAFVVKVPATEKFTYQMTKEELEEEKARQKAEVYFLIDKIDELRPETIILDELAVCAGIGLISEDDMWKLINKALSFGETVVTGRYAPESLLEKADYVSEIVKRKHPFDKGIPARKGVEW